MYKKSIKEISNYLVPFVEGVKYYGSNDIEHTIGTMMILNKHGDILTCRHIANEFINNDILRKDYEKVINGSKSVKDDDVVLTNINLPFKANTLEIKMHKYLDLAVITSKEGFKFNIDKYPVFSKKLPDMGQSVCKLGFAFPEYDLFEYSEEENNIVIKKDIRPSFPLFPMDGIVTRHIMDKNKELSMFETSSPGIRGQSGGPIFSPEGLVYGIQSMTKHIDMNFDIDMKVKRGNKLKEVTYTPFINLGVGVSSVEIIKFLDENKIEYNAK